MADTALITGASGGIGAELAKVFAQNGHDLVIVARSQDKLIQLANTLQSAHGVTVQVIAMDLAQPDAAQRLVDDLGDTQIDLLVNNAGIGNFGLVHEIPVEKALDLLQLNVVTLTHLTRLLLPSMVARGHGRIMNIASTGAFTPTPYFSVYAATKAYVLSLSEAMAQELSDTGVTVTALCPPPTHSDFWQRADASTSKSLEKSVLRADRVAKAGYRAMMKGTPVYIVGGEFRARILLSRLLPRNFVARYVMKYGEPAGS